MAQGRIVKCKISVSERVNDLSLMAALVYTWAITHADDFGRMPGSSRRVKALVVPMRDDITIRDVEACLAELQQAELIIWYDSNEGERLIQFPNWEEHQSNLHKRTQSLHPAPNGYAPGPTKRKTKASRSVDQPADDQPVDTFPEVPGISGKLPPVIRIIPEIPGSRVARNRTEQNGTEQNGTKDIDQEGEERTRAADETWQQAVEAVVSDTPLGTMAGADRAKGIEIDGGILTVDVTDVPLERHRRLITYHKTLQRAASEAAGQPLTISYVLYDPNTEPRAGP